MRVHFSCLAKQQKTDGTKRMADRTRPVCSLLSLCALVSIPGKVGFNRFKP